MKTFKLLFISLVSLGLLMVGPAKAAHVMDVTTDAYQWVNEDSTTDAGGLFTNQTITGVTTEAYLWSGDNISEGGDGLIANLNEFLSDHGIVQQASFVDAQKTDVQNGELSGSFDGLFVRGVLIKAGQETLYVAYDELVGNPLFWNTLFAGDGDGRDISHFTLFDAVIPIPAALWLFAPALLGMLGIRRKYSA